METTQPIETKPHLSRAHEWTHDRNEVLILKCVNKDGTSHGGFKWPLEVGKTVEAADWEPTNKCGFGLHGWPWGLGIGDGKRPDWGGKWIVFSPLPGTPVIGNIGGGRKCKCQKAVIRFAGNWREAMQFIIHGQMALVFSASKESATSGNSSSAAASGDSSSAATSGDSSSAAASGDSSSAAASGNYSSAATSGHGSSAATSGNSSSAATSGSYGSAAASGDSSSAAASGNSSSAASTGNASAAICSGIHGRVKAGPFSVIALAWWNPKKQRREMHAALVGDGTTKKHLKPDTWYRLDENGKFTEER